MGSYKVNTVCLLCMIWWYIFNIYIYYVNNKGGEATLDEFRLSTNQTKTILNGLNDKSKVSVIKYRNDRYIFNLTNEKLKIYRNTENEYTEIYDNGSSNRWWTN